MPSELSALDDLIEGLEKESFQAAPPGAAVPPGAPPSAVMPPPPGAAPPQGGPPMDPNMMPPGAPMDPAMMQGGMPPGAPMDPAMMQGGPPPGPPTMDPEIAAMMDEQAMLIAQNQETMEDLVRAIEDLQAENETLMQNQQQQQQEMMILRAELEAMKSSWDDAMTMPGV